MAAYMGASSDAPCLRVRYANPMCAAASFWRVDRRKYNTFGEYRQPPLYGS